MGAGPVTGRPRLFFFLGLARRAGEPLHTEMFESSRQGSSHVDLAARADVIALVPATADVLARLAHGRAEDLVTAAVPARGVRCRSHQPCPEDVVARGDTRERRRVARPRGRVRRPRRRPSRSPLRW